MADSADIDYARLGQAVNDSRRVLRRFREERYSAVLEYAGNHYSDNSSQETLLPVNLIAKYVDIVGKCLVPKTPKAMLSTFDQQAKPAVDTMQSWMNERLEKMGFEETLHRIVIDSLFSIGIAKVAIANPSDASIRGWTIKAGEIFCEPVDLNDFVYDIHTTRLDEADFIGHRVEVPLNTIQGTKLYDKKMAAKLAPSADPQYNRDGDQTIDTIGKGSIGKGSPRLRDYVILWEIYIPWARKICVIADDDIVGGGDCDPLREFEWIGPDCGPYHFLRMGVVPGNAMPKAPVMDLIDLHRSYNEVEAKLIRQALRQKENIPVPTTAIADAQRYGEAADGEMFQCDTPPGQLKAIATTGANPNNNAYAMKLDERFNSLAGNLALLGGTAHQSPTAAQDKMLNENSSRQVDDMQQTTINFSRDLMRSLGWYFWNHPEVVMETPWSPSSAPDLATIVRKVTPMQRQQTPWDKIDLRVDPYSMQHSTPGQQSAKLKNFFMNNISPVMGLMQQQGMQWDMNRYVGVIAKYDNMPELQDITHYTDPPTEDGAAPAAPFSGGAGAEGGGMPANTTRTYERVSRSQQTPQGQVKAAMQQAQGINPGGSPLSAAGV